MPTHVFANGREIAHAGGQGMSLAFPDVCKTPSPAGPIPIPYPNVAQAKDIQGGPKSVTIEGKMPLVQGGKIAMSTGDEAGSAGGVMSGGNKGEAEPMLYSFDVKLEGKGACRLGDALFHNKKNAL